MLSVLIPVYNYDVTKLVGDLHAQLVESMADFEIIVMEDGSTRCTEQNAALAALDNCHYVTLGHNVGRSAIRNRLADEARYGHLLFLDCDAEVDNPYFIQKYLAFCHEECVVTGGRVYREQVAAEYSLLSTYGKAKERNTAANEKAAKPFTSSNFLISKSIFQQVRFDENIKGYGHEDTIFGIRLQRLGIPVQRIDNPVVHVGIEDNPTFLQKTQHALGNLRALYQSGRYPELPGVSKVLSCSLSLEKLHLDGFAARLYRLLDKPMRRNLLSPDPSLRVFDLYKLLYLCHLSREK